MKIKCGIGWPFEITKKDLRIDFYRGSGNGGQNRNKRDTACRITHIPTNTVTQAQEHRTQEQNKKAAFLRLADILVPIMKNEAQKKRFAAAIERIRTYHEKDNRVTDHRTEQQFPFDEFMSGKCLDEIIKKIRE